MGCMCARFRDKKVDPEVSFPHQPEVKAPNPEVTEPPDSPELSVQLSTGQVRQLSGPVTTLYKLGAKLRTKKEYEMFIAEDVNSHQRCCLNLFKKPPQDSLRKAKRKFCSEAGIICRMDHPNVLRVYEVLEDPTHFVVVTEETSEENLMDTLAELPEISEEVVARAFKQILQAVTYCHSIGVVHSNLSFSEVLVKEKDASGNVVLKLTGFGDAVLFAKSKKHSAPRSIFTAPESFSGVLTEKCDVWSCGILLYMMFSGEPPFPLPKYLNYVKSGKSKPVPFKDEKWNEISAEAKGLISSMLDWNEKTRFTAVQSLKSPWVKDRAGCVSVTNKSVRNSLRNLLNAQACSMLKDAVKEFIVFRISKETDFSEQIESFKALDADGDGTISTEELRQALGKIMPAADAEKEATRIMGIADKNENGSLDYKEFLTSAYNEQRLLSRKNLVAAFNSLDRDDSGRISMQELKAVFFVEGSAEKERLWQRLMKLGDSSGDGEIDFEEFSELMRKGLSL